MALKFYRQRDIDRMDADSIPEDFIKYFNSLDASQKATLVDSRPDLAEALGFVLPEAGLINQDFEGVIIAKESDNVSESGILTDSNSDEIMITLPNEESEGDKEAEEDELAQIRVNRYEGQDLKVVIRDNMPILEALAISDDAERCLLHHIPLIEKQIRYKPEKGPTYGMRLWVCPECSRVFIRESQMEYHHRKLMEKGITHTFYSLDITNRYLRGQMPPHEFTENEAIYIPDTWIEEKPVCPLHDTELYSISCLKRYKDRKITFTGYRCDNCGKIMIRKSAARDLEDECGIKGIPAIPYLTLQRKVPEKKSIPPQEIKSHYIVENGKREPFRHTVNSACYELSEEDTIVVSDSIYCEFEGHESEEVPGFIRVHQKKGGRKGYILRLGYCAQCQKYYMDADDYKVISAYGRPVVTLVHELEDSDVQITSGAVFNGENRHLKNVESKIDGEISSIKARPDYVSKFATGDYDDGGLSYAKYLSERLYGKRLEELDSFGYRPYSYRVDITRDDKSETYYVGAADIVLGGKQYVISANSPFGHDLVHYQTITVQKNGKEYSIKLSRQFDIEDAILYGYRNLRTDEDLIFKSGITDPFLVRVLNMRKKQHNLTDIFVTIQENQNRIVNTEFKKHIIIQGCAGSGKTMVLLHRLSSLNYRETDFDFSSNALILTPNEQFSLHIKGLAEELQIGDIYRASVEQYYIDTLLRYSPEFKIKGGIASEMIVRQSFVDYVYSDQFRTDFSEAYDSVIAKRNDLTDTLYGLSDAMGQKATEIVLANDSNVVSQIRSRLDRMNDLVEQRESELALAIEAQQKSTDRKVFLIERIRALTELKKGSIQESIPRINAKIGAFMKETQNKISELEWNLTLLEDEQIRVKSSISPFGKRNKLEDIEKEKLLTEHELSIEKHKLKDALPILSISTEGFSEDEVIKWMRQVMLIIPDVANEVRLSTNRNEEYLEYTEELSKLDRVIDDAKQNVEKCKELQYSNEVKKTIASLYSKLEMYSLQGTYELVFEEAVSEYKAVHNIKKINGKYHRYDLYARLLFAMKYFGYAAGDIRFVCVDEGQDIALNEYRLLNDLNEHQLIFNIFGDTNQLIKPGRGISDWSVIQSALKAEQFTLNENYRNTNQITKFCNQSFDMNMMRTGVDGAIVREISRRDLEKELAKLNIINERIAILVPRGVQKNRYVDKDILPSFIADVIGDKIDNGWISLMYVDEVKGIEFDKAYVVVNKMSRNEKYIAYTRALSELILVLDDKVKDFDDGSSEDPAEMKNKSKGGAGEKGKNGNTVIAYNGSTEATHKQRTGDGASKGREQKNDQTAAKKDISPKARTSISTENPAATPMNIESDDTPEKAVDEAKTETSVKPQITIQKEASQNNSDAVESTNDITAIAAPSDEIDSDNIAHGKIDQKQELVEIKLRNHKGKKYNLISFTGKLPAHIAKKADVQLAFGQAFGEEKMVTVAVMPEERRIYIPRVVFEANKTWLTDQNGIELRKPPFSLRL